VSRTKWPPFCRAMLYIARTTVARCLSVRPTVRPSHAGSLSKRLNISSLFSPLGSPTILVIFYTKRDGNIPKKPH